MVTTIESLPNEVLEMIFDILGGVPKLSVPGWAMLDDAEWFLNPKDVFGLSCVSKRFHTVGKDQRHLATSFYFDWDRATGWGWGHLDGERYAKLTQLQITLAINGIDHPQDDPTARTLGEHLHKLSSLKHLHAHFLARRCNQISDYEDGDCLCGADWAFFQAVMKNKALDDFHLASFRYKASEDCDHNEASRVIAKLKVRDLTLHTYGISNRSVPCPEVRRIALGRRAEICSADIGRIFGQVAEVWTVHHLGRMHLLPASVQTIGTAYGPFWVGAGPFVASTVLETLKQGHLDKLSRYVATVHPEYFSGDHAQGTAVMKAREVIPELDEMLRPRGGRAEIMER